jgi:hypothetical protein
MQLQGEPSDSYRNSIAVTLNLSTDRKLHAVQGAAGWPRRGTARIPAPGLPRRWLNGDETAGGGQVKLPAGDAGVQRFLLYDQP